MTAILNPSGEIVLPPEAAAAAHCMPGEHLDVMISTSGNILLRRERRHEQTLMQHFRELSGLEIKRRRDPVPPPPAL